MRILLTPKALASSSPGLFQPWVLGFHDQRTLKALANNFWRNHGE